MKVLELRKKKNPISEDFCFFIVVHYKNIGENIESILLYLMTFNRLIGLVVRVFANGPGDQGSIPG